MRVVAWILVVQNSLEQNGKCPRIFVQGGRKINKLQTRACRNRGHGDEKRVSYRKHYRKFGDSTKIGQKFGYKFGDIILAG